MVIDDVKAGITSAVSAVGDKLKDSVSFLSDLKDAGWDKVTGLINDILGLAPLIEATGFSMKDVSVDASIPPSITLGFIKEKDVDPEAIDQLLEANKEKELLVLIVKGLQKADSLQKGMNLAHYKFRGLGMKIGLPPDVSLKFVRAD